MTEVLPAILESSFEGVKEKCVRLLGASDKAQIDIADGVFVPSKTWRGANQLQELPDGLEFDLHLMVDKPEQWIDEWNQKNVFRFTFHNSATYDVVRTIQIIRDTGKQAGVAINLDVPADRVYDILSEIDIVLVMAITAGAQGREFDAKAVDKVRQLREKSADVKIGVDGGVSPIVALSLIDAGVDVLVSGSYIFSQDDIKEAIESLRNF